VNTRSASFEARRYGQVIRFLALVVVASLVATSCGIGKAAHEISNSINQAANVLDSGIQALTTNSNDWQQVLQDMQSKLTGDAQATIRNELTNLLHESIAAAGSEVRCDFDFVGSRVLETLIAIRNKLLHRPVPPKVPALCDVVPDHIDLSASPGSRQVIDIFGYDFDTSPSIQAAVELAAGGTRDISSSLDRQTYYHMTINLGANGADVGSADSKVLLEWSGKTLSSIPIIEPGAPTCEHEPVFFNGGERTYVPPWVRGGDRDFAGHGPKVTFQLLLTNLGSHVDATITMTAEESTADGRPQYDYTTASGTETFTLYTAPSGMLVSDIVGPTEDDFTYVDQNHDAERFGRGGNLPDTFLDFVGDIDGLDAGLATQVRVTFNPGLRFDLTQTGDCVPPP